MSEEVPIVPSNNASVRGNTKPERSRGWCFTLNNWSEDEYNNLKKAFSEAEWIIGKEVGEEKTPHLQGWVYFKNKITLSSLKKMSGRAHWESAKGDKEANVKYCGKQGDFESNIKVPSKLDLLEGDQMYPWEKQVL